MTPPLILLTPSVKFSVKKKNHVPMYRLCRFHIELVRLVFLLLSGLSLAISNWHPRPQEWSPSLLLPLPLGLQRMVHWSFWANISSTWWSPTSPKPPWNPNQVSLSRAALFYSPVTTIRSSSSFPFGTLVGFKLGIYWLSNWNNSSEDYLKLPYIKL